MTQRYFIRDINDKTIDQLWNLLNISTLALKMLIKSKNRTQRFYQLVDTREHLISELETRKNRGEL